MDNFVINIRILDWHFQVERGFVRPRFSRNPWHRESRWRDGYFSVYRFFNYHN